MKKPIIILLSLFLITIAVKSLEPIKDIQKKDGAAPGFTGSPGDSLKDCTSCHGGTATKVNKWITSNMPNNEYEPSKTYTIRAKLIEYGATRFGFEISPQNLKGDLLGKIIITDTLKTKFVGEGEKYISYTQNGIVSLDSMVWYFDWVAPEAGTGELVFYGGFNANYEGHKEGDKTFLSTYKVFEKGIANVIDDNKFNFSIYPIPANNFVNFSLNLTDNTNINVGIYDLNGKIVKNIQFDNIIGNINKTINISDLSNGNYILIASLNGLAIHRKLNIAH